MQITGLSIATQEPNTDNIITKLYFYYVRRSDVKRFIKTKVVKLRS